MHLFRHFINVKSGYAFLVQKPVCKRFLHQQLRLLASKKDDVFRLEMPAGDEQKKPKYRGKTEDYKQQIYLKDVSGRMLGLKTRQEAKLIAAKNKLVLIEDDETKKIPTLKLANPRDLKDASEGSSSSSSDSETSSSSDGEVSGKDKRAPPKHIIFNSKLSDHDLQVKIRLVKKCVAKGQETLVRVTNVSGDSIAKLESIDREFDRVFNQPTKFGTKVNQKRLSLRELKLNVVPVDLALINASISDESGDKEAVPNLEQLDANELLSDDNILEKLDKGKK